MEQLFDRQLRRAYGTDVPSGAAWDRLRDMVEAAYKEAEDHRHMVERSLANMSEELHARNGELIRQVTELAGQASVLENVHDAVLVLELDGCIKRCYAATASLFGLPAKSIVGRSFWEFAQPVDEAVAPQAVVLLALTSGRWSGDLRFRRRDGGEGVLATTLIAFPPSAQAAGRLLAVSQDATDRRRMDRQLLQSQKLEGIGQLAAGIAHEINTPAQYVSDNLCFLEDVYQQLAAAAPPPGAQDPALEALLAEVPGAITQSLDGMRRIAEIVKGIKIFAHPGSGEKSVVDLNHEIETTIAVSRNEWKYVAELITDLDPELPPVPGYPGEIGHVFLNLIVNAAHALAEPTGSGEHRRGRITVTSRRDGDMAEVLIADNGPGIRPEIQSRVFDPFFTTKPVGKGTGQGLAISHRVVEEMHGGTLGFESSLGEGTTFVVRIPLGASQDSGITEAPTGTEGR